MFDFVHKNKKLIQILLAIMFLPFAFFGIDHYFRGGEGGNSVASVSGQPVSQQEFTQALQERQNYLQRLMGGRVDPPGHPGNDHPASPRNRLSCGPGHAQAVPGWLASPHDRYEARRGPVQTGEGANGVQRPRRKLEVVESSGVAGLAPLKALHRRPS